MGMTKVSLNFSDAVIRLSGVKLLEGETTEDAAVRGLAIIEERLQQFESEKKNNSKRTSEILDVVMALASLNFGRRATISDTADDIDAIAGGVNMLGEELQQSTVSLKEKEVLLREIHHRVKNNLQIISSLLNLQAGQINDKIARQHYEVSHERIRAMALVHEKLYQSRDLSGIDFGNYILSLAQSLNASCNPDQNRIRLVVDVDSDTPVLKIDAAIPCALILNELIMNGFKHAFPGNRKGKIVVSFKRTPGDHMNYELSVSDNGVGLPDGLDPFQSASLGLQLVTVLAEQVDAALTVLREEGTVFVLTCKCGK
jgi:two-component sensor histidine kinase